jgi:Flp pilus assembly protein TadB
MNRRLAALLEAHPGRAAIVAALLAGVLALLIARRLFGEWSWMPFVMATAVAGCALLLRVQDRKRFERRRQRMD